MLNGGNQIHNFISSAGSDFLRSYGSGSTGQKVTVPTVPVPQRCLGDFSFSRKTKIPESNKHATQPTLCDWQR
jgi:hypothetical protein